MPQVYLVNPRKRGAARRKSSRKASPAQRAARARFAAMARARSAAPKRKRARVRKNPVAASPARRSHRRTVKRAMVRRNPMARSGSLMKNVTTALSDAVVAGAGGIGVDLAMGQALKFLPDSAKSRSTLDGGVNWMYYGSKAALAIAIGIVGTKYTTGKTRELIGKGVHGSLGIQAYEIMRASLPAELLTLGYYAPAAVSQNAGMQGSMPTGQNTARLGYYAKPRMVSGMAGSAGGQIGSQMTMANA